FSKYFSKHSSSSSTFPGTTLLSYHMHVLLALADDSGKTTRFSYTRLWLEPTTVVSPGYRQDSASSELSTTLRITNHNYHRPLLRQHALIARTVPHLRFSQLTSSPR